MAQNQQSTKLTDATGANRARVGPNGDLSASLTAPDSGLFATVAGYGALRTSADPTDIFNDTFDGALDTTNLWTSSGTNPFTYSGSRVRSQNSTTASATSRLRTVPTFPLVGTGFLVFSAVLSFETAAVGNVYRFFGFGTEQASPAFSTTIDPSTTILNGVGFEIVPTGGLFPCAYVNGKRYAGPQVTSTWRTTTPKRFTIYRRHDVAYFYIDDATTVGAPTSAPIASLQLHTAINLDNTAPFVQNLPLLFGAYNGSTAPGANFVNIYSVSVGDTTPGTAQIVDGQYPWRKALVGASGGMAVRGGVLPVDSFSVASGAVHTRPSITAMEAGNVTFIVKPTIGGTPWTGNPVIVFEQSDDGTSWAPLTVVSSSGSAYGGTVSLGAGTAFVEMMFDAALEGVNYVRWRVTTGPSTAAMTVSTQLGTMPFEPSVALSAPVPVAQTSTVVTATAAAAAAAAATTATPPAGQYVYITAVTVTAYATAAVTGGATPIVTTATNIPGPLFTFATAKAVGTAETQTMMFSIPLRSNAAVTITGPATASILWRVNISYYIGP